MHPVANQSFSTISNVLIRDPPKTLVCFHAHSCPPVVRGTLARLPSTHGKHTELHLLHSQPLVLRDNRGARDHSCRSQVLIKGLTRGTCPLVGYLLLLRAG